MHIFDKPIILTEYPKSGGSWIVSMISHVLKLPARDIYVRPGFDHFDIYKHPWYKDAIELDFPLQSVIKSHELPGSSLIDFDGIFIHLVRDGRDVVVSKWFFDKYFCTQNGITKDFEINFDEYVDIVAGEWVNYVSAWTNKSVIQIRYEDFLYSPIEALDSVMAKLGCSHISKNIIERTVSEFTKEKFKVSLDDAFKHNTFVRKGVAGDWKNHFSGRNVQSFKVKAGQILQDLGYEKNSDW